MAMAGKKNSCFLARPENNFESKQTYFSYSPNKDFHPPEFQAKLFFTRNWVGGFYWDCLLNLRIFNGRIVGDLEGKKTCFHYNGSSVVDYVIGSKAILQNVRYFKLLTP